MRGPIQHGKCRAGAETTANTCAALELRRPSRADESERVLEFPEPNFFQFGHNAEHSTAAIGTQPVFKGPYLDVTRKMGKGHYVNGVLRESPPSCLSALTKRRPWSRVPYLCSAAT